MRFILLSCLLLSAATSMAQPYHVDSTFGINGIVLQPERTLDPKICFIHKTPDGRFYTTNLESNSNVIPVSIGRLICGCSSMERWT